MDQSDSAYQDYIFDVYISNKNLHCKIPTEQLPPLSSPNDSGYTSLAI